MSIPIHFLWSPNFTRAYKIRDIRGIVIHTAECAETDAAPRGVGRFFQMPTSKVSAHYTVGAKEICQSVKDNDVAWHAGDVNGWTIGIELIGTAKQTPEQWGDSYSSAVLANAAELVASLCQQYTIPILKLTPDQVRSKTEQGIFGHHDQTLASKKIGGHYDPGPHFPWGLFLDLCRKNL